jgi:glyceraldehyde-3-phosphate dehydrogenase/erythrose-4-phosphate dehydrogenase
MTTRIGINGFGRMGRLALRAGWAATDLSFAHINEIGDANRMVDLARKVGASLQAPA